MQLNEICEFIVDCPHSTVPDEGEGYPLIRTPNVGRGRLLLDGVYRVSERVYKDRTQRGIPHDGDIIFAREAPVGNAALITNGTKVCLGQRTVHIRPNQEIVNPEFLVYYLLSPEQQYKLLGTANGATVAHVNLPVIRNLSIELPDRRTQDKIASIISTYDDFIENNRKQIKLLEEAAQRLYKEWFVDLHFPGYEDTKIVDGVPEGWKESAISDLCHKINAGGTPSRWKDSYYSNKGYRWFKTKELLDCWLLDSEEHITQDGLNGSSAKLFPPNTIVMAIYASPTLGRLGIMRKEACTNQAALCMSVNEDLCSWQWLYQKLHELRDEFNAVARGAGQQNISGDVVKSKVIILPKKAILDKYTAIVAPFFEKKYLLTKQIVLNVQARDRLLPKLMSGELEV